MRREIPTSRSPVLEPSASKFVLAIVNLKITNHKPLFKYHQNSLKKVVRHLAVRFINLLFLFGICDNCLRSGTSRSFYLATRKAIKQTGVIITGHHNGQ